MEPIYIGGESSTKSKKPQQRRLSREFEDVDIDIVTGKLVANLTMTKPRSGSFSTQRKQMTDEESTTWVGDPEAILSVRRPLKTVSAVDIETARIMQQQASPRNSIVTEMYGEILESPVVIQPTNNILLSFPSSENSVLPGRQKMSDKSNEQHVSPPRSPIVIQKSLRPLSSAHTTSLRREDVPKRSNSFHSNQDILIARRKAAQLPSSLARRTEAIPTTRSNSFSGAAKNSNEK